MKLKSLIDAIAINKPSQIKKIICQSPELLKTPVVEINMCPLSIACAYGQIEAIEALVKLHKNPGKDNDPKPSIPIDDLPPPIIPCLLAVLHAFEINPSTPRIPQKVAKIYNILIEAGAKTDYLNPENGVTLLHLLAQEGFTDAAELLLKVRPTLVNQARTSDGATPLHLAAFLGHHETCALLLRYGANAQATNTSQATPMHEAATKGSSAILKMLMEVGAPINSQDFLGNTPLMYACTHRNIRAANLLLMNGAEIHHMNAAGQTARYLCVTQGLTQISFPTESSTQLETEACNSSKQSVPSCSHSIIVISSLLFQNIQVTSSEIYHPKQLPLIIEIMAQFPSELNEDDAENFIRLKILEKILTLNTYVLDNNPRPLPTIYFATANNFFNILLRAEYFKNYAETWRFLQEKALSFRIRSFICFEWLNTNKESDTTLIDSLMTSPLTTRLLLFYINSDLYEINAENITTNNFYKFCLSSKAILTKITRSVLEKPVLNFLDYSRIISFSIHNIRFYIDIYRKNLSCSQPLFSMTFSCEILEQCLDEIEKIYVALDILGENYVHHSFFKKVAQQHEILARFFLVELLVKQAVDPSLIQDHALRAMELLNLCQDKLSSSYQAVLKHYETHTKLSALIKKINNTRKVKNHKRLAVASNQCTGSNPESLTPPLPLEDVNQAIHRLENEDKIAIALQKRNLEEERLRLQKKCATTASKERLPNIVTAPLEPKWTEIEVRTIHDGIIGPKDTIQPQFSCIGVPYGTYWACFQLTREDFNTQDDFNAYRGQFLKSRIADSAEDNGIIRCGDMFYFRMNRHSERIHLVEIKKPNKPILLLLPAEELRKHKKHERDLREKACPTPSKENSLLTYK